MSKLYKVQPGDNLSKIATRFSIHLGICWPPILASAIRTRSSRAR